MLANHEMPASQDDFFAQLDKWFPTRYDIKFIIQKLIQEHGDEFKHLDGGLEKL